MAMTDCEVQKQINHMIAFIEQEASEKIEEIDAKAEEEFNIEKGRIVQQERLKIMESYNKKEKTFDMQKKIQFVNMMHHGRIQLLQSRQDLLDSVIEEARSRINEKTKKKHKSARILRDLILEGIFEAMEPNVVIRCREQDISIVESVLPDVLKEYANSTQTEIEAVIDKTLFLSPYCSGGVEVIGLNGRLKVNNTLDSRLDLICQKLAPQIRVALFGPNPARKFSM